MKMRLFRLPAITIVTILFCSASAYAAAAATAGSPAKNGNSNGKSKNSSGEPVITTGPIETLQEALYKNLSKTKSAKKSRASAAGLKKAADALEKGNYATAKSRASAYVGNAEFGDYARWISATAALKMARASFEKGAVTHAKALAQGVPALLSPIPNLYPYSPLIRTVTSLTGQAELIVGRAECHSRQWSACRSTYEKAFQRLHSVHDMVFALPADVAAYAESCTRAKTELCQAWVQRLAFYYSKSTPEFKALAKFYPQYLDNLPRSTFPGRLTLSYKAADPDQVSFDAAMALYLDTKYSQAIQAFRKFGDEYPRSAFRYRARFWLAQSMLREKKDDEAKKILDDLQKSSPLTYYGLLAALTGSSAPDAVLRNESPMAQDFDPFLQPYEITRLRRAQVFLSQKAYGLAATELRDFRAREQLSSPFLVYLAMLQAEARSYAAAFPILNELIARGHTEIFSTFALKMIFPVLHYTEIKKYAEENKLDPILVLSLMKQESAFDEDAISSSGALGLMQLMPVTAADTISDQPRADLVSAEPNIRTGTRYLSQVLSRFRGNIVLALAGYNAGPTAVARWTRSATASRDMLEFIESIPYKETREYVSSIIRNYFWYAKLLDPTASKNLTLSYFWGNYGPQPRLEAAPPQDEPKEDEGGNREQLSQQENSADENAPALALPASAPSVVPISESSPLPAAIPSLTPTPKSGG